VVLPEWERLFCSVTQSRELPETCYRVGNKSLPAVSEENI